MSEQSFMQFLIKEAQDKNKVEKVKKRVADVKAAMEAFGGALDELEGIEVIDTDTDAARALQDMYKALSRLNGTYFQTEDGTDGGDELEDEPIEGEEEIEDEEEVVEEPEEDSEESEEDSEEDEEEEETPEDDEE